MRDASLRLSMTNLELIETAAERTEVSKRLSCRQQSIEARKYRLPGRRRARREGALRNRSGDRAPAGGDIGQVASGDRLDHHIAQRSRLDRSGDERAAAGVGGKLAQEL